MDFNCCEDDINEDYAKDILEFVSLSKTAIFYRCKLNLDTVEDIMISIIEHLDNNDNKNQARIGELALECCELDDFHMKKICLFVTRIDRVRLNGNNFTKDGYDNLADNIINCKRDLRLQKLWVDTGYKEYIRYKLQPFHPQNKITICS